MTEQLTTKKVSLTASLVNIQMLLDQVEAAMTESPDSNEDSVIEESIQALMPKMETALDQLQEGVDRRIGFLEYAAVLEKKLKDDAAYFSKKAKTLANIQKRLKEHTKKQMEEFPEVEFKGTRKRFTIQKNGGKSPIDWNVELDSISNLVDPTKTDMFPEEFIKKVVVFQLDKAGFEDRLRKDPEFSSPAAKVLDRGTSIRIK